MARRMDELVEIFEKEIFSDMGCQYYREVEINGRWRLFDVLEKTLLAYSMLNKKIEILVVINVSCTEAIENKITVDRNLSPVGSKFKDMTAKTKAIAVEESNGRSYLTVKLKPNSFAVLKKI